MLDSHHSGYPRLSEKAIEPLKLNMNMQPLFVEIPYVEPSQLFSIVANEPWCFFLDSANSIQQMEDTNRYSYIGFDPFETVFIKNHQRKGSTEKINHPFQYVKKCLEKFKIEHCDALPPFQGGAVGYFSYDLCHYLEKIPYPSIPELNPYADLALGFYDMIVAFDHVDQRAWIISTGFPETAAPLQLERAKERLDRCQTLLGKARSSLHTLLCEYLPIEFRSPFNQKTYAEIVQKAQHYILEGDIFEVNLSHRFSAKFDFLSDNHYALYLKIRHCNPSPFSAFLNLGDHHILSTSPERFLSLKNNRVSTRPIKGTAPRSKQPQADSKIAAALATSEKDRSENIMIVDLLRNDLSKVCLDDSVMVKKLCGLETYPTIHHLVSVIEGQLLPNKTALDLLEACFPGGSVTGAPKIRAMEIIYELEPTPRGPYCGSIGFIGFNGNMDTSITIRTLLMHTNTLSYQTGGAVVLDSSPESEYHETLIKSAAIRQLFSYWNNQHDFNTG